MEPQTLLCAEGRKLGERVDCPCACGARRGHQPWTPTTLPVLRDGSRESLCLHASRRIHGKRLHPAAMPDEGERLVHAPMSFFAHEDRTRQVLRNNREVGPGAIELAGHPGGGSLEGDGVCEGASGREVTVARLWKADDLGQPIEEHPLDPHSCWAGDPVACVAVGQGGHPVSRSSSSHGPSRDPPEVRRTRWVQAEGKCSLEARGNRPCVLGGSFEVEAGLVGGADTPGGPAAPGVPQLGPEPAGAAARLCPLDQRRSASLEGLKRGPGGGHARSYPAPHWRLSPLGANASFRILGERVPVGIRGST